MLVLIVLFVLPAGILMLISKFPLLQKIGAIALCYFCGIIMSLLPIPYDKSITMLVSSVLVAIAIPLIIFGFDLKAVRSLTKDMAKGYGLQIVSAIIVTSAVALTGSRLGLAYAAPLAGMTTGLFTGGTPNLIAVGTALLPSSVSADVITAANTSDVFVGGVYFLLLLTILRPVYRHFLGKKKASDTESAYDINCQDMEYVDEYDYKSIPRDPRSILRLTAVILLAAACLGIGALLEYLINGNLDGSLYIMITVSVLGLAGNFIRPVRETKGSYQIGQYLVLVFSLGLSMSIDFSILVSTIMRTFVYFACAKISCMILHLLLCKLFRLDGGTALITHTAGIYGPPFIAPVAGAYGEKQLIAPGIICAVIGLVFGNFLGIATGSLLSLVPGM